MPCVELRPDLVSVPLDDGRAGEVVLATRAGGSSPLVEDFAAIVRDQRSLPARSQAM
ncbi:hypothetical protein [Lentzea sp. NPDC060358]|uniref:hypothetical protein n=1 Tax=Lentzea sp. NPDC060358 TaxID=3347103 RepID=UPI00365CA4F2